MIELYLYFSGMLILPMAGFNPSSKTLAIYLFWPILVPAVALFVLFRGKRG